MRASLVSLFLVGSVALVAMPGFALAAGTPQTLAPRAQPVVCASVLAGPATDTCARSVQDRLNANPAALRALRAAAKSDDKSAAKSILREAGLTERQLADATIVLKQQGGATTREEPIGVTISCCPLTITITIKL